MEFDKSRVYTSLNADELRAGDKVIVGDSLLELKGRVEADRCCGKITEICGECTSRRFAVDDVDGRGKTYWELAYLVERVENCGNCGDRGCPDAGEDCKFLRCADWQPKAEPKTEKNCSTCSHCSVKRDDRNYYCDVEDIRMNAEARERNCCSNYIPKTEKKASAWLVKGLMDGSIERTSDEPTPDKMCEVCIHRGGCIHSPIGCDKFVQEPSDKYRPFKDTDELIKVWTEKTKPYRADTRIPPIIMPLIWVRSIKTQREILITGFGGSHVKTENLWIFLKTLFNEYTFLDGSVCGVEE